MTRKDASPAITFVLTELSLLERLQSAKRGNSKGSTAERQTFEQFTVTRMEFQPLALA